MDFVTHVLLKEHPVFPRCINKVRQLISTNSCIYNYCKEPDFIFPPTQKYKGKSEVYWTCSLCGVKYSNANVVVWIMNLNRSMQNIDNLQVSLRYAALNLEKGLCFSILEV